MTLSDVKGYFRDPEVSTLRKLLGVGALLYVVLPVDVVPDFIPVIGWLDDLGVVTMVTAFLWRDINRRAARTLVVG